jgi:hypothetical protein
MFNPCWGRRQTVERRAPLDNEILAATSKQADKSSITGGGAKLYDEVIE